MNVIIITIKGIKFKQTILGNSDAGFNDLNVPLRNWLIYAALLSHQLRKRPLVCGTAGDLFLDIVVGLSRDVSLFS